MFDTLAFNPAHAALSKSDLKGLGKQASDTYLHREVPLAEAVIKVAQELPNINQDQIRRVVEHANAETFQTLFTKQASDKNIEFDIADPEDVIRILDTKARPPMLKVAADEYGSPPPRRVSSEDDAELYRMFGYELDDGQTKTAAKRDNKMGQYAALASLPVATGVMGGALGAGAAAYRGLPIGPAAMRMGIGGALVGGTAAGLVGLGALLNKADPSGKSVETIGNLLPAVATTAGLIAEVGRSDREYNKKTASAYPDANPHGELIRTWQRLTKVAEDAKFACDKNESLVKAAHTEFTHHLAQDLLSGGNMGAVAQAINTVSDLDTVKLALSGALPSIISRGVDPVKLQAQTIAYEMEKGASVRAVNPNNPLVSSFAAFNTLLNGQDALEESYEKVARLLVDVDLLVKEAYLATAARGAANALRGGVKAIKGSGKVVGSTKRIYTGPASGLRTRLKTGWQGTKKGWNKPKTKLERDVHALGPSTPGPKAMSLAQIRGKAPLPKAAPPKAALNAPPKPAPEATKKGINKLKWGVGAGLPVALGGAAVADSTAQGGY